MDRFEEFEAWAQSASPVRWLSLMAPDAREIGAAVNRKLGAKSDELLTLKRQIALHAARIRELETERRQLIELCEALGGRYDRQHP